MEDIVNEVCDDKLNFKFVPIRALKIKSRTILSILLNGEQVIPASNGHPRDYRGIADLFGFDNALLRSIERSNDPMKIIIETLENQFKWTSDNNDKKAYTFQDLIDCLEKIERFDVIDDLMDQLKDDTIFYQQRMKSVTLFRETSGYQRLTVDDDSENESKMYDAYICYADEDIQFVSFLAQYLESSQIGLRLFIRDRDLLVGSMKYDAFTYLIEKRCNYIVIVLTPDFLKSPECDFQARFATGLQIEQRSRKLIPIILKACEIPPCIRYVSKIDFSRGDSKWEWIWRKLITSISSKPILLNSFNYFPSTISLSDNQCEKKLKNGDETSLSSVPQILPSLDDSLSIHSPVNTNSVNLDSQKFNQAECNSNSQLMSSSNGNKVLKKNWIKSIKQKLTSLSSSESCTANGYYSLNDRQKIIK